MTNSIKLNETQIKLLDQAMNYNDRESQLSDNMSNLYIWEAIEIMGLDCSPEEFYNMAKSGANSELSDLFDPEHIEERIECMWGMSELEDRSLSSSNKKKAFPEVILWIKEEAINAYFDHQENGEGSNEIAEIEEQIKTLQQRQNLLIRKKELEKELELISAKLK